jgi:DNA-binding protein HU-beta
MDYNESRGPIRGSASIRRLTLAKMGTAKKTAAKKAPAKKPAAKKAPAKKTAMKKK